MDQSIQNNDALKYEFDVLIIGAGLVGASLACALEKLVINHGLKVALVEPHDLLQPRDIPPSFDARASALSWGTRCVYDHLNLWDALASQAQSITEVHVSDRGSFGIARLRAEEEGFPALGFVIKNHVLGDVLLNRLRSYQSKDVIKLFNPDSVTALSPIPNGMKVTLESSEITASLVVLADGGRSGLMEQLGISQSTKDYQQHGMIANIALDVPHQGVAWERFAGQGPMALLPLIGDDIFEHRAGLVWTVADHELKEIQSLSDQAFLLLLQQRFGHRAGRFIAIGKRDCYPLTMKMANEQVRPGLVVLGNAAHAIHPIAGQGYNLSIRDTMALTNNIEASLLQGLSVGNLRSLLQYEQQQQPDQTMTSQFCNGLVQLFSRTDKASILARNLGLISLDYLHPVKSRFIRKAMGL